MEVSFRRERGTGRGGCGMIGRDADRSRTRRFPLRHHREETIRALQAERSETRDMKIESGKPVS